MKAVLSTSAGILHTLTDGPRYGRDLIRLLSTRAQGTLHPRPGTVYRAFESLVRNGYVRSWTVVPGGRPGARSRKYYELTSKGIALAEEQREAMPTCSDFRRRAFEGRGQPMSAHCARPRSVPSRSSSSRGTGVGAAP
jgi:DNA-binding PadR family transcriptional regulator